MQFFGNINRLRAMRRTLVAPGTMVGLPQFGYTSVISYEKSTACFPIILILAAFRHISFIDTFIVMYQDGRNVNSIRARHAVLAVVARYGGVLHHQICRIIQILGENRHNGMPKTPHCVRVRAASAVPQYGRGHWRAAHPAEAP